MKRTLLAAFAVISLSAGIAGVWAAVVAAPAAAQGADVLIEGGLRLPKWHRYEVYSNGQYSQVDVMSVPQRVGQGAYVYDRTEGAWVNHPSVGGRNPRYASGGGNWSRRDDRRDERWDRVRGTVENVNGHEVTVRADDGRTVIVDIANLRDLRRIYPGDRIVAGGITTGNRLQARFVREARQGDVGASAPSQGQGAQDQGGWLRIHGRVQDVQGSTLRFRADDGRMLTVDMRDVNPEVQRALDRGEGATLIGFAGPRQNEFRAEYIQQDSSDPARGGTVGQAPAPAAAPPAAAVDEKAWQRIHGKVQSVQGSRMRFRADDGRMLTVDMTKVNPAVQKALTPGEGATVIGHYQGDNTHVAAQYVQQDSSAAPAASPKTTR